MSEQAVLASKGRALELRCRVLQAIRRFFLDRDFLEVQTPVRTRAPAPEVHIDAVPSDGWFLSTSPELYMKRLLAAGYERIFQMAPVFRKGERGRFHHPEFIMLEWYRLGCDYTALQDDCRSLLHAICQATGLRDGFSYGGKGLEVKGAWPRWPVREAFRRLAGWDPCAHPDPDRFDLDLVEKVEPRLGYPLPCFLVDYPAPQAALARLKPGDPEVAERFELYWAGLELANGFSELIHEKEQRERFLAAVDERRKAGRSDYPLPEAFLRSLAHLGDCAGIALGVDRLVMILADAVDMDEVVAFPPGWE